MKELRLITFAVWLVLFLTTCARAQDQKPPTSVNCIVGNTNSCSADSTCMNISQGVTNCSATPAVAPIEGIILPFGATDEVFCTHSAGDGSHSYPNAFYAVDLATPYDRPAATVRAAADGKAFIFLGEDGNPCPTPQGSPKLTAEDKCGNGWGNNIKILHANGYYSFYVHLEQVLIKNGDIVKKGQAIGIEGTTGWAGHRHLHWSVQKLPGKNQAEWESRISWIGDSVPFNFLSVTDGKEQLTNTAELKCAHANIGAASPKEQPTFKGVKINSGTSKH